MRRTLILLFGLGTLALISWGIFGRRGDAEASYRFVEVERGNLEAAVTATGKLETVTTVEVGTQVSGQIAEILADFNSRVRKGQLIARIDPTLLEQEVRSAEAAVERREAEERQRRWEADRAESLHADSIINDADLKTAGLTHSVAEAELKTARVSLDRARRNLTYTEIRAPIDGVVVERNVDVGQTVAASLSAPVLFRIAGDLSRMRILASVDESDIGRIHSGQNVRFTVQAYPDERFAGTVDQVRLQSAVQENVVNYVVVVSVGNPSGRLLPGMTATVSFIVQTVEGVLKVANAALRLRPTEEMWAELRANRDGGAFAGERRAGGNGAGEQRPGGEGAGERRPGGAAPGDPGRRQGGPRPGTDGRDGGPAMLWFIDEDGRLNAVRVKAGVTSGQETQVEGERLREGMKVIAGITGGAGASPSSPFQSPSSTGRRGPPGPM
jgi:HlyD family secretion protein